MKYFLILSALLSSAAFAPSSVAASDLTPSQLTPSEQALVQWVAAREARIVQELSDHVAINTGSENVPGIDQYRDLLAADLRALGFKTEQVGSPPLSILSCRGGEQAIADHLVARRAGSSRKLLLNGHMDTVFSATDEFQSLQVLENGVLQGPGVADMKGGIVVMLNALRAVDEAGLLANADLTVLLNSDEEIGSLGSRELIESLAAQHELGLVFESSYNNQLSSARKGLGQARLKVTGREAHAGAAHADGVSANLELAHKIIEIEKLTDYDQQATVNVGVMSGGEKRNTVPGCADAYIDMRFTDAAQGAALKAKILEIASASTVKHEKFPALPTVESWAVLHRPAKAQHPVVDQLIAQAMDLSALIGEPITGAAYSGGGTDGSIAQAVGLPTIDSLGVDGVGAHSSREATTVQSLIARTQLVAVMLARLLAADPSE